MDAHAQAMMLGQGRWTVPLLAALAPAGGARFAEMAAALGIHASSLKRTLDALIAAGWIARNPGHGHPLRPEYLLTADGRIAAQTAARIGRSCARIALEPTALNRWSLPIVHALDGQSRRFSELGRRLDPITPRALSLAIKHMVGQELVARAVVDSYPPTPLYSLSESGAELAAAL